MTAQYRLIFGGLQDTSTDTLRKVRGVLVGDLGLPIEEAKKILLEAPLTILSEKSDTEILACRTLLEKAGALVTLTSASEPLPDTSDSRPATSFSSEAEVDKFWQELEGSCLLDITPSILRDVKGYNPLPSKETSSGKIKVEKKYNVFERTWKKLNRNRVLSAELTFSLGFSIVLLVLSMATA